MSGDCFEHVWNRVESDCMDKLKEYIDSGLMDFGFTNIHDHKYMLHNCFEGYYKIAESNIWMKRLDWFLGCDDGEETFQKRLADELHELAITRRDDRRCFDCSKMGKDGCELNKSSSEKITLTDKICSDFFPVIWTNYVIHGG